MIRGGIPASPGTSFVGRERELAALVKASRSGSSPSTARAGQARRAWRSSWSTAWRPDEALFADLAPLARGSEVWPSLAQLVDARQEPGVGPADAVVRALANRELILVLDNCEHVLDSAREVAGRLLDECAGLTVLATSRGALGLAAERVWPVPPLSVPPDSAGLAEALERDSGRLFVERAARALPGFTPSEEDAPGLVRMCRRLDGIPLAIELAAARIKVLGPRRSRSGWTTASGCSPRRTRRARRGSTPCERSSTGATSCWTQQERLLLLRLSVFSGGFELDAVESVCTGDAVGEDHVVDLLAELVDKALSRGGSAVDARVFGCTRRSANTPLSASRESSIPRRWPRVTSTGAAPSRRRRTRRGWARAARRGSRARRPSRTTSGWRSAGRSPPAARGGARPGVAVGELLVALGTGGGGRRVARRGLAATEGAPPSVDRARALTRAGDMESFCGRPQRARASYEGALESRSKSTIPSAAA